ncbi:MAG: hypothetical protein CFE24_07140 [Flavobacterium sp. BFFFF2]|nr:MAG: hypothetical protein CFE24_07140 [Flavobacterium sp. BFFFF2]
MKAIILNLLFVIVWTIVGHYCGVFSLFFSSLVYPTLFIFSAQYLEQNFSRLFFIPFCFFVLLISDYLFRIFGGGIHDDAGKGLCEINFYLTMSTSILAMFFVAFKLSINNGIVNKQQWFYNNLLVVFSAIETYVVFMKYIVKI